MAKTPAELNDFLVDKQQQHLNVLKAAAKNIEIMAQKIQVQIKEFEINSSDMLWTTSDELHAKAYELTRALAGFKAYRSTWSELKKG